MNKPKAITTGVLNFGSVEVDVYNLDDGRRVISQRAIIRALTSGNREKTVGSKTCNLDRFLSSLPENFQALALGPSIEFVLPSGGAATGREAAWLVKLCRAYDEADRAGVLHHKQQHLAAQARAILNACAEVGITALVDEATGYQYVRHHSLLAEMFAKALRDQASAWQRTWQDDVIDPLCHTFRIQRVGKEFPAPLMGVVGKLYRTLFGVDIHDELKRRNPGGDARDMHTQWMSDDTLRALESHLPIVKAFALTCDSKTQFWQRLERYAQGGRGQL